MRPGRPEDCLVPALCVLRGTGSLALSRHTVPASAHDMTLSKDAERGAPSGIRDELMQLELEIRERALIRT